MNKTLYLPDECGSLWDRARELSGNKLSPIVIAALRAYVLKMEAESKDFERIVLKYSDAEKNNMPTAKAFYGRWIYPISKPYHHETQNGDEDCFAVAQTSKGNFLIFSWNVSHDEGGYEYGHRVTVFGSLEAAAESSPFNSVACRVMETLGVPVEELDI